MIIFKKVSAISLYLKSLKLKGKGIGFVPTMGALHIGHLSLIEASKQKGNVTIASIFVNPTQFNDKKDFELYPITTEKDIAMLANAGCDILFIPSVDEMYPYDYRAEYYELGELETILEGKFRNGHFQGVCQIVHRLLSIVEPNQLFLGQKDFQQCMVVSKMIQLKKLEVSLIICPTLREASGLAFSSRNMRLTSEAKQKATAIYQSMVFAKDNVGVIQTSTIENHIIDKLTQSGFSAIDYVSICEADTLLPLKTVEASKSIVILIAAFLDNVRLIDNLILS